MDRAAAHVFVGDIDVPELAPEDLHHLQRVLRLAPGTHVTVSDGAGRWRPCVIATWSGSGAGRLDPVAEVAVEGRGEPSIGVAFAITKGERPDWTVQKLTELGVDVIIPLLASRSVVRPGPERADRRVERWRRVSREAAGQCRRAWLPQVEGIQPLDAVVSRGGVSLAHPGGRAPSLNHPTVVVGPEGGWDAAELARAEAVPRVDLGPLVMRAETAAIAAGVLLGALRNGLVRETPG